MATKKNKKEDKLGKAKAIVKKINGDLIDASFNAIETTVKTGEKWQKLTAKLVKKTEPLTKQQINMVVETAESIKEQLENSTNRLKTLVGYDPKMLEKAKKMFDENPLVEKAEEMKKKVQKEVSNNKLVKKAEKMSDKLKKNISDTIDEVKEKIEEYAEDAMDTVNDKLDKANPKKENKTAKKSTKKTVKKTTKKPVEEKVVTTEEVVVKKIEVTKTAVVNDLKVIKGIGPVLETSLNNLGVTAFEQIAKMTIKDMDKLLTDEGINAKIYDLSGWKAQAKLALKGDMEAVKNYEKK